MAIIPIAPTRESAYRTPTGTAPNVNWPPGGSARLIPTTVLAVKLKACSRRLLFSVCRQGTSMDTAKQEFV